MGRNPEGPKAREVQVPLRMTPEERRQLDVMRWRRENLSRAEYIRRLIVADKNRWEAEDHDND